MHDAFLDQLAQPRPDPGGGAAAAHGGILALAIMEKIARLESKRTPHAESKPIWEELIHRIRTDSEAFRILRERDCTAFLKLAEARAAGLHGYDLVEAWEEAVACPMSIMETAAGALGAVSAIGSLCGRHLVADLHVAAEFLAASFRAAFHIAISNVNLMPNHAEKDRFALRLSGLLTLAESELKSAQEQLRLRPGLRETFTP